MKKLLLLIADDDEVDRDLFKKYARDLNATIIEANSCKNCLEILEKEEFDCLIIDYYLGDCTGYELITEIIDRGIDSGIIVVTGRDDDLLAKKVMKLGVDDYIPKDKLTADIVTISVLSAIRAHKINKIIKSCIQQLADISVIIKKRDNDSN